MGRKRNNKTKNESGLVPDKAFDTELLTCQRSDTLGRYFAAKKDVKKGTIILKEKCLVAGPKLSSGSLCIGCHADYTTKSSARFKCSKCGWPLCTVNCEKSPHHAIECNLFKEKKIQPPATLRSAEFGAVAILRGLLLKKSRPNDWRKLMSLEHHNEERKGTRIWEEDEYIIKVIKEFWGLTDFSEEDIHTICGIYEVNGFEMGEASNFGGIFPSAAMIAHSCADANAAHFENADDGTLEIVSVQDIPAGTPITMCYDGCLKATAARRKLLQDSKYFNCICQRCLDPTELGTHLGALLCTNSSCKGGWVLCNIKENSIEWKCVKCMKEYKEADITRTLKQYEDIAENQLHTVKMKEDFLKECKAIFHPNHYIPLSVKFKLCLAYGHEEGYTLFDLSSTQAHRKLELCQEVLKILDVLTPGYTTPRGNILYEIQAAEVLICRNLLDGGKCSKALIKRRLQNCLKLLEEAIAIFELCYPMRLLAESVKTTTLSELQGFIRSLK